MDTVHEITLNNDILYYKLVYFQQVRQKRVLEAQKAFDSFKVDKERTNSMRRPGLLGMAQSLSMMSIKSLSGLEEETSVTNKDMNTVPVLSVQERRKQNDLEQMRRLLMQVPLCP